MKYVAIDLGDARTGLASGDSGTAIVSPLGVVEIPRERRGGADLLDEISRRIHDQLGPPSTPGEIVVGLPLNMDGTTGPRARIHHAFAKAIAERTGRAVRLQDERLTSDAADWELAGRGLTRGEKKKRRDALSAAGILRDFLASVSASRTDRPPTGADP